MMRITVKITMKMVMITMITDIMIILIMITAMIMITTQNKKEINIKDKNLNNTKGDRKDFDDKDIKIKT